MNEITVHVTSEDIENGVPLSMKFCPIALAACRKRAVRDMYAVIVGSFSMTVYETEKDFLSYMLPVEASRFVRDFDNGIPVEEFKFTVRN